MYCMRVCIWRCEHANFVWTFLCFISRNTHLFMVHVCIQMVLCEIMFVIIVIMIIMMMMMMIIP